MSKRFQAITEETECFLDERAKEMVGAMIKLRHAWVCSKTNCKKLDNAAQVSKAKFGYQKLILQS